MGMFNSLNMTNQESKSLFLDSLAITTYTYHNLDHGLKEGYQKHGFNIGLPLTLVDAVFGSSTSQGILPNFPGNPDSERLSLQKINDAGWSNISAAQLNYSGKTNSSGTFLGEKFGFRAAQAEVMGKYDDEGNLIKIGIGIRGTTGPRESLITDTISDAVADILTGLSPEYSLNYPKNAFNQLLTDIAEFATKQGLTGEDIIITGHSLGGAATNSIAQLSPDNWGGFYQGSKYVAFASPTQYESAGNVINVGYENDPVFRVLNGKQLELSSFLIHDADKVSATNNIVNFNDYYASDFWKFIPTSLVNLFSWISHMPYAYDEGMQRIVESQWYNLTEKDSTVVVANLSDNMQEKTWVEDLNRYAQPHVGETFIIGSEGNDLIRTKSGINYLDGAGGDDIFSIDKGFNIIYGGTGQNTLELHQPLDQFDVVRAPDDSLYFYDGDGNMTVAKQISTVKMDNDQSLTVSDDGLLTQDGLLAPWTESLFSDDQHMLETDLSGVWLFGQQGDDVLTSTQGGNTFVAGQGNDELFISGGGNTLIFEGEFGQDVIHGLQGDDKLIFIAQEEARSDADYTKHISVSDEGVLLTFGHNSVLLNNISFDMFSADQIVIA
ncbi:Lipase precursor [Pragia fontium]|uniref:polyurethane esterase n=1 Tax=Pragia fontium TaxID=82985 RepID=UPI000E074E1A|nr:polyurethanase [Pragia fontium]SUB82860.1 Lipase precursor [Pragia fontium]